MQFEIYTRFLLGLHLFARVRFQQIIKPRDHESQNDHLFEIAKKSSITLILIAHH